MNRAVKRTLLYPDGTLVRTPYNPNPTRKHELVKVDRIKKSYRMNFKAKRKIEGASIAQYFQSLTDPSLNQIFFTLTIPESEKQRLSDNSAMKRFRDNMLKRDFQSLIWTRELTKKGTPHFHCLACSPFVHVKELQAAWNSATNLDLPNSFRVDGSWKIQNLNRAVNYVVKYVSKCAASSQHRLYGVSGVTCPEPVVDHFNFFANSKFIFQNPELGIEVRKSHKYIGDVYHFVKGYGKELSEYVRPVIVTEVKREKKKSTQIEIWKG
jgi:hypothetical protein